jgi:aspartyl protease family protein
MSIKPFLYVIGVGAAFGFLLPTGQQATAPPTAAPQPTQIGPKVEPARPANLDVVLTRKDNGHFFADVEVNGQMIHFLVDTGATAIALTADDARRLGFIWSEVDLEPVGRGVSGPVNGKMVELHHMKLGGKEAWDMHAAIIPEGLEVSLLGQTFLSQIGSVKITNDQMVLR